MYWVLHGCNTASSLLSYRQRSEWVTRQSWLQQFYFYVHTLWTYVKINCSLLKKFRFSLWNLKTFSSFSLPFLNLLFLMVGIESVCVCVCMCGVQGNNIMSYNNFWGLTATVCIFVDLVKRSALTIVGEIWHYRNDCYYYYYYLIYMCRKYRYPKHMRHNNQMHTLTLRSRYG